MNIRTLLLGFVAMLTVVACKKEFDAPPIRTLPIGEVKTIADIKAMYNNVAVTLTEPMSVYATVTTDETDGNFYKNITVQDSTGGITLRLINSGGLYIGDSIRIYLPGVILDSYNNLMQLTNVNVDNNVVKQATQRYVQPRIATIPEIVTNVVAWQSTLVKLEEVEFIPSEAAGSSWCDPTSDSPQERHIEDCNGNVLTFRNSQYSNYAATPLPQGKGSIVVAVGLFGTDIQLGNQGLATVQMNGPRCPGSELPFFIKDFNDASVTSGGWTTWSDNNIPWATNTQGSNDNTPYGVCKNFINFVNVPGEAWLISPVIDLTGTTSPYLKFITGCNYNGAALQVLVSTDYVTGDPSTGNWTALSPTLSPGSWTWVPSGNLDLTTYSTSATRIAFKYTGSSSDGKTWELDDIQIVVQ